MSRLVIPACLLACWVVLAVVLGGGLESWPWLLATAGLLATTVLMGSLQPPLQFYGPARVRGAAASGQVALTFDDGPDPVFTPRILDALDEAGARGTFFVVGSRVDGQADLIRQIVDRGHQIGHHGHAHRWQLIHSPAQLADDYLAGLAAIRRAVGRTPRLFRPPVGVITPEVIDVIEGAGAGIAAWSVRPYDGRIKEPEEIRRRVASKIRAGDVVLLHDASLHGRWDPPAADALPGILEDLEARGLRSVTMAELFDESAWLEEDAVKEPPRRRRSPIPLLVGSTLLALLVFSASQAFAGDRAPLPSTLIQAATELAAVPTVRARFTQTKTSVLFTEPVVQPGRLLLRRADNRIVWEYDGGPSVLLVDGKIYAGSTDSDAETADGGLAMPGGPGLAAMFEALFAVDPEQLAAHFEATDKGDGRFELRPRSDASRALFSTVTLQISGNVLERVEMAEVTGDATVVQFTDVEPGADIPDARFKTPLERGAEQ